MKVLQLVAFLTCSLIGSVHAQDVGRARALEKSGDPQAAEAALARAVQNNPRDIGILSEYAELLDRYREPAARAAYEKVLIAARNSGDNSREAAVVKRLITLDLINGDSDAASRHIDLYHALSGKRLSLGTAGSADRQVGAGGTIQIPGPMRSFSRMAALSADAAPDDILPALARNVVTNGYQASHSNDALEQTEYLKLVHRYLSQARELEKLAGPEKAIVVENCESPKVAELLRVLGFRMRGGCGGELVLETVNATRAFLTTDSGFPVHDLELALRTNRPFRYAYAATEVPVLYGAEYWLGTSKDREANDFLDVFLSDPGICRLYLGLSKLDRDTGEELRKAVPMPRLKAYAHVLDFFGSLFEIRNGKALVPGGQRSTAAWADLTGVSPDKGAAFFEKLIAKDDGWLASLYDALARIRGPVQDYLTEPARMKRFYSAVRGRITSPGPARPVFRSNTDMLLLTTRLRLDKDGRAHVPGGIEIWKSLFVNHPQGKYDGKLTRAATNWKEPDDVLEALFALCRKAVENEPLKIFMMMSDLDRNRTHPLEPATVNRLARQYRQYGAQYSVFNDAPDLPDKSILQYLDTAEAIGHVHDPLLRADTAGSMQALVGLWQVASRERNIAPGQEGTVLSAILTPFASIRGDRELFDASRAGINTLLAATAGAPGISVQEHMLHVLAGSPAAANTEAYAQIVQEMGRVLEAQRILSLDTLFQTADHLSAVAKGERVNTALLNRVSSRIAEIQAPRASLSAVEKNALGFGYWTEKHIDNERKLNVRALVEKTADKEKLADARGALAPFLRDTLVAFLYAHYAPPGAQILYTNPVFVRSHDFLGIQGANHTWKQTEVFGTGWPSNGGGRLVGSLSGLPYALAEAEQNFLVPQQTQALIWGDLVPQMILSAKIPRWWHVTPAQMHWVGLHMRYGETLFAEAAMDPAVRDQVIEILARYAAPARTGTVRRLLEEGGVNTALAHVTPSELFLVAREASAARPDDASCDAVELRRLAKELPEEINYAAISRAFGTPKPTLANSYRSELLYLRTFPTLMGYSSRIMAESWESNTLYWAALADETHLAPAQLNVRIPEWTQRLVERIFASHLEDWPALLHSLRLVGDDVRAQNRATGEQKAALQN